MAKWLTGISLVGVALLFLFIGTVKAQERHTFTLPSHAKQIAPNVYDLGEAVANGKTVQGYAILHYKDSNAKPGGGSAGTTKTTCYGFLAQGAKWKNVESWKVNPTNTRGLNGTQIFTLLSNAMAKWEAASTKDILGTGFLTSDTLVADTSSPDDQNEVYFADISDPNTIAVTIVWGIFSGPLFQRQLVEWDQVYDDTTFDWSAQETGVSGKMDFDNIATHELGHAAGLADLYNTCTEETMYGYSATGETKKRDLNTGDITGIKKLYQ